MNDEVEKSPLEFEKQLCLSIKRIDIRRKRGRKVPLILTQVNGKYINLLIKCSTTVGVSKKNPYIFPVI